MDPITIVASCIAILQALDRIAVLSSKFRGFLGAPNDAQRLINESLDLRIVLDRLQAYNAANVMNSDMIIMELLASCEGLLARVENLVQTVATSSGLQGPRIQMLAWIQKRHAVAILRQELREIKSTMCLQFLGVIM